MLLNLWDESRRDSVLCGSTGCMDDNSYYQQLRIEVWNNFEVSISVQVYWIADLQILLKVLS